MTPEEKSMRELAAKERMERLIAYLDKTQVEIERGLKACRRVWGLITLILFFQIGTMLADMYVISQLAGLVFWMTMMVYYLFIWSPLQKAFGCYEGCLETLTILGFIEEIDWDRRKRNRKRTLVSFFERMWAKIKQQKREEVYGTT